MTTTPIHLSMLAAVILLAGCASQKTQPQHAQKAKVTPMHSLAMENQCRENAAHRYNLTSQNIRITDFDAFQGSYEMQGSTARQEGFTCAFDMNGQFLHLSMR
ncbi:YsaB family lipoprotein [Atlantibacter subterranea]|uniref:YsaB family lipoprotein n=1 Tax=Atlantibacter subterraneus TaxID=255519 RepID=A0ABU4DZ39_9ENTR|nr:YsaB family lipoprotein [Atlantibacter subterranea]MDV7022124.1 YsaB family lipoprotein [Atlantibacter subterranea]MDZ5665531.1 YsaB family lipoprotein [Atlantibacter hermannii]